MSKAGEQMKPAKRRTQSSKEERGLIKADGHQHRLKASDNEGERGTTTTLVAALLAWPTPSWQPASGSMATLWFKAVKKVRR